MTTSQLKELSPTILKTFLKATKQLDNRPELETLEGLLSWMGEFLVKNINIILFQPVFLKIKITLIFTCGT